jgi:BCD family chlorophyll transporter-like MFS transporter
MLAYSMQDLILEPFAGMVFGMTPGETTRLAGVQHGGVFAGMVLVAVVGKAGLGIGSLRSWTIGGCIASGLALAGLVVGGLSGPEFPLRLQVFLLGVGNGAFAVAAIGSMMQLSGTGQSKREGLRMGLWGASQAIAFAAGGFVGAAAVDLLRMLGYEPVVAFTMVFMAEALMFLLAARLAASAIAPDTGRRNEAPDVVASRGSVAEPAR